MTSHNEEVIKYKAEQWKINNNRRCEVVPGIQRQLKRLRLGEVDRNADYSWINFLYWIINTNLSSISFRGIQCNRQRKYLYDILNCALDYASLDMFQTLIHYSKISNTNGLMCLITPEMPVDKLSFLVAQQQVKLSSKKLIRKFNFNRVVEIYDCFQLAEELPVTMKNGLYPQLYDLLTTESKAPFHMVTGQNTLQVFQSELINNSGVYNELICAVPSKAVVRNILFGYLHSL